MVNCQEQAKALYSSIIKSIKVVRSGKVKRAKLYYLRDRKGKSARISEKIKKKIGIDVSEQKSENQIAKEVVDVKTKPDEKEKIKETETKKKDKAQTTEKKEEHKIKKK